MFYLLNPKLWIAVVIAVFFAGTHMGAYRSGRAVVQAKWDKQIAAQKEAALNAEQAARKKEQELIDAKQLAEQKYVQLKKQAAVSSAAANDELGRLRDELATSSNPTRQDSPTCPRTDARAGLESELLGYCAKALTDLAAEADRLETLVVGLQQYVKNVCQKQ